MKWVLGHRDVCVQWVFGRCRVDVGCMCEWCVGWGQAAPTVPPPSAWAVGCVCVVVPRTAPCCAWPAWRTVDCTHRVWLPAPEQWSRVPSSLSVLSAMVSSCSSSSCFRFSRCLSESPAVRVYCVRCVVCGVWYVMCGVWCVVCDVLCVACGV